MAPVYLSNTIYKIITQELVKKKMLNTLLKLNDTLMCEYTKYKRYRSIFIPNTVLNERHSIFYLFFFCNNYSTNKLTGTVHK